MANSAGNQALNHRMCKWQQMHWSLWVARPLAQVQRAAAHSGLGNRLTLLKQRSELPTEVAACVGTLPIRLARVATK
jgi:hypothetical protein